LTCIPVQTTAHKEFSLIRSFLLPLMLLLSLGPVLHAQTRRAASGMPPGTVIAAAAEDGLRMTLAGRDVTVSGATPHAGVLLFGMERESSGHYFTNGQYADVQEAPAPAGPVTFRLPRDVARDSVWIAADVVKGTFAVAAPEGSQYHLVQPPADAFTAVPGRVELAALLPSLVIVRHGVGAWTAGIEDGALVRGQAKRVAVDITKMRALRGAPGAPAKLLPHDLVIGIDPQAFEYFVYEVTP
jgi:hypothetical protein